MLVLLIYMLTAVVVGYLAQISNSQKLKDIYLFVVFFFAFLYSGLRGPSVGIDTAPYYAIFEKVSFYGIHALPRNTRIEEGYSILNYLLSFIIDHPQIIILFGSGVICYSFYKLIKTYSTDYALSSLIFIGTIFTRTMNVSRQYIAIGFAFFAIMAIIDKKFWRALLWLGLSISMHNSMVILIFLLIFALPKIDLNRSIVTIIGFASIIVLPIYRIFIDFFVGIFPQYKRFLELSTFTSESAISFQMMMYLALIITLALLNINPFRLMKEGDHLRLRVIEETTGEKRKDELVYLVFFVLFIEYIVSYLISANMMIVHRLTYIFQPAILIVIPNTISMLNKKYSGMKVFPFFTAVFVLYFILTGMSIIGLDSHGIYPYVFFWQ